MPRLSKRVIDEWLKPENTSDNLWDDAITGFGLRRLKEGRARFFFKYRVGGGRAAQQRWLSLGTLGSITADQARYLAQQAAAAVARGEDPQAVKSRRQSAPTMAELWQRFEAEQLPRRKPRTQQEYRGQWARHLAGRFGKILVASVDRAAVDQWHKSISHTPYHANRVLALLSRLMTIAERWEWRPQGTNPCRYIERFPEKGRTRYLSIDELDRLGTALVANVAEGSIQPSAANAIRFLLLTGARLNEALTAERAWLDMQRKVLALPDSKTGAKPIYLSEAALAVLVDQQELARQRLELKAAAGEPALASPYIFPGRSDGKHMVNLMKPWKRICDQLGFTDVRLHDLRHTTASLAVGLGASLPVIGRLLGHSQAQTTLRYAHVDTDPALAAVNAVGEKLGSIMRRAQAGEGPEVMNRRSASVSDEIIPGRQLTLQSTLPTQL